MDPVSFVKSLEIEDFFVDTSTLSHAPTLFQGKDQGLVDAGSLVSFVGDLTSQNKEDVLNSTMLAQLAANKKYVRNKDFENWYKFYLNVMGNIGWVMPGSFHFSKYQSHESSFKISEAVIEILEPILAEEDILKVVKATISSLQKSQDGLALFEHQSSSEKSGNFQIIPCSVDKSGQITVALLGSYFESISSAKDYFFFTWSSQSINLLFATETITLNESVYSQVREEVKKKLGERAKDLVKDLDI